MENKITAAHIEQFQAKLVEDEKSKATIEKYLRDVRAFFAFAGEETVTKETAMRYKEHLKGKYKPASINSMLAAMNRFFKEMGWFDCIVKALKIQREAFRSKERELSKAEYFRLLEAAKEQKNTRLYLLMETLCSTGIRISELPFITVEAVQSGRALRRELKHYIKEKSLKNGSIFVTKTGRPMDRSNILHDMKALCDAAGVNRNKVFPHNLRHLFACLFYRAVKDLSRLADLLGHSNINTTRIYTCVSGDEQERQIERLGLVRGLKEKTA